MDFDRLLAYDDWANREEVRHLRSLSTAPERATRILAHVAGTEWLWMERLRNERGAEVWPDWDLARCQAEFVRLYEEWKRILPSIDLHAVVGYVNSKGEPWKSRAEDILMHTVLHGAYHRGQIATIVREAGTAPAYTDYIHCIRQGWVA